VRAEESVWFDGAPLALQAHANASLNSKSLAEKYHKLAPLVLDEDNITLALNEEYVPAGAVLNLKSGDVVALIPPISGG